MAKGLEGKRANFGTPQHDGWKNCTAKLQASWKLAWLNYVVMLSGLLSCCQPCRFRLHKDVLNKKKN